VAPTGRTVEVRDLSIWRFVGGESVEDWTVLEQFSLLQQLGVISPAISGPEVASDEPEGAHGQV